MTSMIIEYDLRSPGRNYDDLYRAIKSYGAWAHITESTWFIKPARVAYKYAINFLRIWMAMTASLLLYSPE